ncbi:bidirectional sugar transporter SWEET2a-like [Diospyros lotus]|uniref:bidirectional sugar transporter SWEET2a-like n=1 Tax=Diospyros lotus TaxID=55363 RepID=UPI002256C4A7|nr:bidirectional sugar transporter SWEET2a-like [Diospyros lotus]
MMDSTGLFFFTINYSFFTDAAGIAGNLFALVLFVSPFPTFRRIIRNKSTEQFSGLPYIYGLLNGLVCLWYGLPIVSNGTVIAVAVVNSIGATFQLFYIAIFIIYAEKEIRVKMMGLLLGVFGVFAAIAFASLNLFEPPERQIFVGYLSAMSLISMFASPMFVINLVIKTKSVEYMPFSLSLATFLTSFSFFLFGALKCDLFLWVPNGIGMILGIMQLVLYYYCINVYGDDSRVPLLESFV